MPRVSLPADHISEAPFRGKLLREHTGQDTCTVEERSRQSFDNRILRVFQ